MSRTRIWATCAIALLWCASPFVARSSPRPDASLLAALRASRDVRADEIEAGRRPAIIQKGSARSQTIALTFDDGPHPELTSRTLQILKKAGVHATFFMTGRNLRAYPESALKVVAAGHEIANHTFTHPNLTKIGSAQIESELESTSTAIEEVLGISPALCRPPGGQYNPNVLEQIRKQGMTTVLWTANPADYACETGDDVAVRVLKAAKPGGIILLHDTWDLSVEALPEILAGLKKKKLRVVTVSGLR